MAATTKSYFETNGLVIDMYKPAIDPGVSYDPNGQHMRQVRSPATYQQQLEAIGGYWAMQFTLTDDMIELEGWIPDTLNQHVEVHDAALEVVWEGFVNQISISSGGFSFVKGPLLQIGNEVNLGYSTVDTTTIPPTMGERDFTTYATHVASQTRYGTIYKLLSTGGVPVGQADQLRDSWLAQHSRLRPTKKWSSIGGANPTLTVDCLGYVHRLNYPYRQVAQTLEYDLDDKMADILDYCPDGLFSSANATIATNTFQVIRYENQYRLALPLIKSLLAVGDATDARYLFRVGKGRYVTYEAAPTEVEYIQNRSDAEQKVTTIHGDEVPQWRVQPGKWLLFPDFLVGTDVSQPPEDDPRAMFIESVMYTIPNQLELIGSTTYTIDQKLGQLGLMGVGV